MTTPSPAWDLIVIGGGTAGLVGAYTAAELGARVALVERARTGGDCLWTGCVPSKTLLSHARKQSGSASGAPGSADARLSGDRQALFGTAMEAVRDAIRTIEPEDSPSGGVGRVVPSTGKEST